MARLQRITISAYYDQYCSHQFAQNHLCWLDGYDSEIADVRQAKIIPRLFVVSFSDRTETVIEHTAICYVQVVPGTLRNY